MHLTVRLKHWFFSNYWWLLAASTGTLFFVLAHLKEPLTTFAGVAGAILSTVYFIQKQKLEELRLFREIFKECNARYDAMNERVASICDSNDARLNPEEATQLIDYFNLCGEEYLYYKRGYIPPEVWEAWFLGMQIVISSPRVNELWRVEASTGSYYGLPLNPFNYTERER